MNSSTWNAIEGELADRPDHRAEPVPAAEFDLAIHELGFTEVPENFREFVLRYGAAQIGIYPIYGLRKTPNMSKFDGTFIEETKEFRRVKWPGVENWIVISIDQSGNPIGLAKDGSIWLSDTDFDEILCIAENFEAFLINECLREEEEEDEESIDLGYDVPVITPHESKPITSNGEDIDKSDSKVLSSTLNMIKLSGGDFEMGSILGEGDEKPVHTIQLSPFYIAENLVTWEKWQVVKVWAEKKGYVFTNPGRMGGGSSKVNKAHPVTDINWYDAVLWCNALSEMEGKTPCYHISATRDCIYRMEMLEICIDWVNWSANGYRLPTEAEWEYACRAGTSTIYYFGDTISKNDANYGGEYNERDGTTPVGQYKPNAWGLYDMHGNAEEWCWDWYGKAFYKKSDKDNPKGPQKGTYRILRGGGWFSYAYELRSARRPNALAFAATDVIGFRPVCLV